MIDKEEAKRLGLQVKETTKTPEELLNERIALVRSVLPEVVDGDGVVNVEALKDFIGKEETSSNDKGYELTFAGKGLARAEVTEPTTKELAFVEAQSKSAETTGNVVLLGDNLDALKILKNYAGKVKCIYIDPPYNTGNDGFIYKDNFKETEEELIERRGLGEETTKYLDETYGMRSHSGWLSFMWPRLKLAREMLTDDGVLFISIDDNEQANLKIICDEIFGESNFIANICIHSNPRGRQSSENVADSHEYVLVFSKKIESVKLKGIPLTKEEKKEYNRKDSKGLYREIGLRHRGSGNRKEDVPTLHFPIYYNEELDRISLKAEPGNVKIIPKLSGGALGRWSWSKKKIEDDIEYLICRKVNVGLKSERYDVFRKDYLTEGRTRKVKSVWLEKEINYDRGAEEIRKFSGGKIFNYSKPIYMLKKIIQIATDKDDLVMDFFAGSGTTADAVMRLNQEDGGDRKFILVQWKEKINDNASAAFFRERGLEPVISSICLERVRRAGERLSAEQKGAKLDVGFKTFELVEKASPELGAEPSDFRALRPTDKLYNMMAASNKSLTAPIEVIEKDVLFKIEGDIYVLGKGKKDLPKEGEDSSIYIDGYADIDLTSWLNMVGFQKENVIVLY